MTGDDVTVKKAIEIRRRVELAIREELQALMDETGLIPRDLSYELLDVTQMSNSRPRYVVGEVKIRIEL